MARNFTTQTIRRTQGTGTRQAPLKSPRRSNSLVGEPKRKIYRKTGGNTMVRVMAANRVSINNPKNGRRRSHHPQRGGKRLRPNYVRRNILVKGALLRPTKDVSASPPSR